MDKCINDIKNKCNSIIYVENPNICTLYENIKMKNNKDKNDKVFKTVVYFIATPSTPIILKDLKLQKTEVDYAGFYSKEEADKRILWRLKEVLKFI